MNNKPNIIFLGAFKPQAADGTIGGQAFACISLVESALSEEVEWHLIDSTQRTQQTPGALERIFFATRRMCKACWLLMTKRIRATLIFSRYEIGSFLEKGIIAIAASILGQRSILSIRTEVRSFPHDRYTTWFRKIVVWSCHSLICQSEEAKSELISRLQCPAEKIIVIPNWIDSSRYVVEKPARDLNNPVRFLFMGWIEPFKGVRHLIDAAVILRASNTAFKLDFCGGGSELAPLIQYCEELGLDDSISFNGWVTGNKKASILASADVLVLPSYSEGMPNSVLEGMASGLAVIATIVGGIPSLVQSEKQGLLINAGSVDELAQSMKILIDDRDLIEQMGCKNQEFISQRHDISSVWPIVARVMGVKNPDRTRDQSKVNP
ncbi:glycosyltransferase family 4 protein [bacterium]|nr:glycosyltransferase family 4 protein [bacterium]